MSFSNPVIGGGNQLIREEIKSPDFVTGVSGWCIRKDGSAEFNDVVVRGEFDAGAVHIDDNGIIVSDGDSQTVIDVDNNLLISNVPNDGSRVEVRASNGSTIGGFIGLGITSPMEHGSVASGTGSLFVGDSGVGVDQPYMVIGSPNIIGKQNASMTLTSESSAGGSQSEAKITADRVWAQGAFRVEYAFEYAHCIGDMGTPSIPTGVGTNVSVSAVTNGDPYGMISSGTITIPWSGLWDVGVTLKYAAQAVSAGIRQAAIRVNGVEVWYWREAAGTTDWNNIQVAVGGSYPMVLNGNDVVSFTAFHNAGASLSLVSGSRVWARM